MGGDTLSFELFSKEAEGAVGSCHPECFAQDLGTLGVPLAARAVHSGC